MSVGGVAIEGSGVLVGGWAVNRETEENLIVDVDVLAEGLVGIQRLDFTFDKSSGSSSGSLCKVSINFGDSSISLHSLDKVLTREVLDNLELFIPVMHLLRVNTV